MWATWTRRCGKYAFRNHVKRGRDTQACQGVGTGSCMPKQQLLLLLLSWSVCNQRLVAWFSTALHLLQYLHTPATQ